MGKLGGGRKDERVLGGTPEKRTIAKSIESEEELAETVGGRRMLASGSLDSHKGDVECSHFKYDEKRTGNATVMSLYLRDLTTIQKHADAVRKHPALRLVFEHLEGTPTCSDWVMIPLEATLLMMGPFSHIT